MRSEFELKNKIETMAAYLKSGFKSVGDKDLVEVLDNCAKFVVVSCSIIDENEKLKTYCAQLESGMRSVEEYNKKLQYQIDVYKQNKQESEMMSRKISEQHRKIISLEHSLKLMRSYSDEK